VVANKDWAQLADDSTVRQQGDSDVIYEAVVGLTALAVVVLVADAEFLLLARILDMAFSAESARSSASSSSCCTLRYLAKLIAAISSCTRRQPQFSLSLVVTM